MFESILAKVQQLLNRLGQSSDSATSSGSIHAKTSDIRNNMVLANGGSIIKSVQRGTSSAAGSITINAININKSFVRSASKGSTGTVAATGNISSGTLTGTVSSNNTGNAIGIGTGQTQQINGSISGETLSGGTTDLTVKVYSAKITSSTTLSCDGPCEWEVVEYV